MAAGANTAVDFTFHNLCLSATKVGYGVQLGGNAPVLFTDVLNDSVAYQAGARPNDYLICFNGRDVQLSSCDEIGNDLIYSHGSALELRVARPHPVPVTDIGNRRALLTLQTKLRTGDYVTIGDEVEGYKSQLNNALADVDDILGGFELPAHAPSYGGTDQEIEISMYDSRELDSPPSSQGSDPTPYDPLLDFTGKDDFTSVGGSMNQSVQDMQREIQKMNVLMKDVNTKKQNKIERKSKASVSPSNSKPPSNQPPTGTHRQGVGTHPPTGTYRQGVDTHPPTGTYHPGVDTHPPTGTHLQGVDTHPPTGTYLQGVDTHPPVDDVNKQLDDLDEQLKWIQSPMVSTPEAPPPVVARQQIVRQTVEPRSSVSPERPPPVVARERPLSPQAKESRSKEAKKNKRSSGSRFKRVKSPSEVGKFGDNKKVVLPSSEPTGYIHEPKTSSNRFEPMTKSKSSVMSSDRGLPSNISSWTKEQVGQWIKAISMSLYAHYYPLFSRHQITGRSLLRLNDSKLKSMGITNTAHCRTLATEIARIKVQQEHSELKQFQNPSDDESGVISDV